MSDVQRTGAKGSLLVIEDDLSARKALEGVLSREGYDVRFASDGRTGLMSAEEDPPELILLDVRLPDLDGYQTCRLLKQGEKTCGIPVIFLTALEEDGGKVKGFQVGGVDYITQPFPVEEMLARVETHLAVRRLQRQIEAQHLELQKEMERSRRAAEEWEKTFNSISDPISIHDRDFRIVRANQSLADMAGMESEHLLGKKCCEVLHATEGPWPSCPHRQAMECGKPVTEEFFEPHLGRYLEVSASPICDEKNEVIGSVHITKDITARKRGEESIRRSEERFKLLSETSERLLASSKPQAIVAQLCDEVMNHLECQAFFHFLVDAKTGRLHLTAWAGIPDDEARKIEWLDYGAAMSGWVAQRGDTIITEDIFHKSDPRTDLVKSYGIQAYGCFPLMAQGQLIGTLSFGTKTRTHFSLEALAVMRAVAHQVSLAMERVRMMEELERSRDELEMRVRERTAELALLNERLTASNQQLSEEIRERQRAEEALQDRLRFEHLLSDLSVVLGNVPSERVDLEIEAALEEIRTFFDVDRSGLLQVSPDGSTWRVTHTARADDVPPLPVRTDLPIGLFPWVNKKVVERSEIWSFENLDELPMEAGTDQQTYREWGVRSGVNIPIPTSGGSVEYIMAITSDKREATWPEGFFLRLRLLGESFVRVLERKRMDGLLQERIREIEGLKQQLEMENISLREEIRLQYGHDEIVGRSASMRELLARVEQVARTDSTVLIQGETGTGKELVARAIHHVSARKDRALVTVNCAALPPTLIESELFGREKGAYTGALTRMVGRFEAANGSTLLLDEVGELPLELQSKLLRVLEEGRFERLGSAETIRVNVRIIAATNRDLAQDVRAGKFRKDLYYRLNVFPIVVPPLREHAEDIPLLVWAFVRQFEKKMGKRIENVPRKSMETLQRYPWPGNARELRNVIENAMIVSTGRTLEVRVPSPEFLETPEGRRLEDVERGHILGVLEKVGWRLAGKGGAAEILGLKRGTLQSRMKKLGIQRPRNQ